MKKFIDYLETSEEEKKQLREAFQFAKEKHKGQKRKFDKKDYVVHPSRVANIVRDFKKESKNLLSLRVAAYLHDTLEDTETSATEIRQKFGNLVMSLVKELTSDVDKIEKVGKTEYLADKLTNDLTDYGLVLKLADRLDNVSDLHKASESFVQKYKKETEFIINKLEKERKLTETQKKLIAAIKQKLK